MANVHTRLPDPKLHRGEHDLASYLSKVEDEKLHLWFGINYIPGVKDIDILLYHEDLGAFVIEVKGVPLRAVLDFGYNTCRIEGRSDDRAPQVQANAAMYDLKNTLGAGFDDLFLTSTVCWPKIFRSEWDAVWDKSEITGEYSKRMMFQEDLDGTDSALRDRLKHVRKNPLIGNARTKSFKHSPELLKKLKQKLLVVAQKKPMETDLQRLRTIESRVAEEVSIGFDPLTTHKVVFVGGPGSGKTFRLLQVAFLHAKANKTTLFLCYNKVLAADIKRLLKVSEALAPQNRFIEIRDVYELLKIYSTRIGLTEKIDYDVWARDIIKEMLKKPESVEKYDAVLLDEAQDLPQWTYELVQAVTRANSSVLAASGPNQALYGGPAENTLLGTILQESTVESLDSNFRNTEPVFKLATVFLDAFGKTEKEITASLNRFRKSSSTQDDKIANCERKGGLPPLLVPIDESAVDADEANAAVSFYLAQRDALMIQVYSQLIQSELDALREGEGPIDLLILVPREYSESRHWAVGALRAMGAEFVDYTDPKRRRDVAQASTVRLCTYHSSRGIEGQRVLIFGFENIDKLSEQVGVDVNNLGYIALSRASIDLKIAHRISSSSVLAFLRTALSRIRKG